MNAEEKIAVYDKFLQIEAYSLKGIAQPFPMHFHEYYVAGFIESGGRKLFCNGNEYSAVTGDILLFNPNDKHSCTQSVGGFLNYRAMNINTDVMAHIAEEISGAKTLPKFRRCILLPKKLIKLVLNWQRKLSEKIYKSLYQRIWIKDIFIIISRYIRIILTVSNGTQIILL